MVSNLQGCRETLGRKLLAGDETMVPPSGGTQELGVFQLREHGSLSGLHELVAATARFIEVARVEGSGDPLFCVVRLVDGVAAPPSAVVVPEIMVRIGCLHEKRFFGPFLRRPTRDRGKGVG